MASVVIFFLVQEKDTKRVDNSKMIYASFLFYFSLQQKKQLQKQRRNNVEQLVVNHVVLEMTETCRDFVTGIAETIYPHGSSTNAYLHVS